MGGWWAAPAGRPCAGSPSPRPSRPPDDAPGGPADQSGTTGAAAHVDERPDEEHALPSRGRLVGTRAGPAGDARGDEPPRAGPPPKAAAPGDGARPRAPKRPLVGGRRLGTPAGTGDDDDPAVGAAADADGGGGGARRAAPDGDRDDGGGGSGASKPPPSSRGDAGDTRDADGVGLVVAASDDDKADDDDAAVTGRGDGEQPPSPSAAVAGEHGGHSSPSLAAPPPACRGASSSSLTVTAAVGGGGGGGRAGAWRAMSRRLHSAETAKRVPSDALRRRPPRPVWTGSASAGATSGGSVIAAGHKNVGAGGGGEKTQAGTVGRIGRQLQAGKRRWRCDQARVGGSVVDRAI